MAGNRSGVGCVWRAFCFDPFASWTWTQSRSAIPPATNSRSFQRFLSLPTLLLALHALVVDGRRPFQPRSHLVAHCRSVQGVYLEMTHALLGQTFRRLPVSALCRLHTPICADVCSCLEDVLRLVHAPHGVGPNGALGVMRLSPASANSAVGRLTYAFVKGAFVTVESIKLSLGPLLLFSSFVLLMFPALKKCQ